MRFLLLPAAVLLTLSAGCGGHASGTSSLELREVVPAAMRIGGTGTGAPLSPAARQSRDPAEQTAAVRAIDCTPGKAEPLAGHDDRALPLVTCGETDDTAYLLEPAFLSGSEVSDATSGYDALVRQWVVELTFDSKGTKTWADFTSENVGRQVAFVVDSRVVSVTTVRAAILDGAVRISGKLTKQRAGELARQIEGG
ncbi:precorrin-3B C(17)-methyltransferase [Amycolatopsis sp. SID8362]|uniref:SecDF P1 head subdomain-containing protein n=1 Tax=Amycolatopsis sp. SID8362 TaxID=2690346 RepID=UPI00136FF476|nr:precorrin-3B C(17)-methyltransferase [Amycolatopsis sp. SID8362]NBH03793.1 precorrin-3B C(17)-methyltransferase [Amycolatopsis sp. SID8362]NED40493.1 precorrin-3B C(17)-methyltransferase [Amycolatopsis sp. SID8362]